mmetsp:Transcript_29183/g.59687  ORF Transcript_29183/g.59687 Transcript_29183/m.59687 type:complete len:248 (+) Transcript_29183:902-1645(+)
MTRSIASINNTNHDVILVRSRFHLVGLNLRDPPWGLLSEPPPQLLPFSFFCPPAVPTTFGHHIIPCSILHHLPFLWQARNHGHHRVVFDLKDSVKPTQKLLLHQLFRRALWHLHNHDTVTLDVLHHVQSAGLDGCRDHLHLGRAGFVVLHEDFHLVVVAAASSTAGPGAGDASILKGAVRARIRVRGSAGRGQGGDRKEEQGKGGGPEASIHDGKEWVCDGGQGLGARGDAMTSVIVREKGRVCGGG